MALRVSDLHLGEDPPFVVVERGKGGKGRTVPVAPEVAAALDKYRRARRGHRLARPYLPGLEDFAGVEEGEE